MVSTTLNQQRVQMYFDNVATKLNKRITARNEISLYFTKTYVSVNTLKNEAVYRWLSLNTNLQYIDIQRVNLFTVGVIHIGGESASLDHIGKGFSFEFFNCLLYILNFIHLLACFQDVSTVFKLLVVDLLC